MSLSVILNAGIETVINRGREELASHLAARTLSEQKLVEIENAVNLLPNIIEQLNRAFQDEACMMSVRVLFPALMTYLWQTNDLLPSRQGQAVLGLLDDTYLAVRVAREVDIDLDLPADSLTRSQGVLKAVLPEDVVGQLDQLVEQIITDATASAEQRGL